MKKRNPRIVVIGGGTGLSTLLRGLKEYPFDITAIVTVADDGGSSGRLRDDYDIPPPGDIRNVIAALSDVEPLVEQMFQYRFTESMELGGHSLGNLMLTALTEITGDFNSAVAEMSKVLNVRGRVIPAANEKVTLLAKLQDGTVVKGESAIPTYNVPITRVFLEPQDAEPLPAAIIAIQEADYILIGPGSLYTSIIPNLLVRKIGQAIINARGRKIYLCNLMTQKGETIHYRASDHVNAIHLHTGKAFIETILVHNEELPEPVKNLYREENSEPVQFDIEQLESMDIEVIQQEIALVKNGIVRHNAANVAAWLNDYVESREREEKSSNL